MSQFFHINDGPITAHIQNTDIQLNNLTSFQFFRPISKSNYFNNKKNIGSLNCTHHLLKNQVTVQLAWNEKFGPLWRIFWGLLLLHQNFFFRFKSQLIFTIFENIYYQINVLGQR